MRLTKRKLRRREEQAAVDAVYMLCEHGAVTRIHDVTIREDDYEPLWSYLAQFKRSFRCPRCGGGGHDPEQPPQTYPPSDPPDPCGLCMGYGTINSDSSRAFEAKEPIHPDEWDDDYNPFAR